jgi:trans-L-3-hydroxyproline dehydratase
MCGHGIIAVTKVVLETGLIPLRAPETVVKIDTPAGLVTATARIENQSVKSVCFQNVPSFVYALDQTIEIPGIGTVAYDIAFGGAFYAFVSPEDLGMPVTLRSESFRTLIDLGMQIKNTIMKQHPIEHPFEPDLSFLYGTIFVGKPESGESQSRNVCIFAEGEVDRSPTGTGVSARVALHYARKEIGLREPIIIESIIGSRFTGSALMETKYGPYDAVIPEIEGRAFITGEHTFFIDPEDPWRHGFILR